MNEYDNYDWLILVIDADDMTAQDKIAEVDQFIQDENLVLNSKCRFHIIAQKCCMETWFLGNKAGYTRNPSISEFGKYNGFYNVYQEDPEFMIKPDNCGETLSIYHYEYLKQMLLEKNVRYSKTKPNDVGEYHYIEQLQKRVEEINHLSSLRGFFNFCATISAHNPS